MPGVPRPPRLHEPRASPCFPDGRLWGAQPAPQATPSSQSLRAYRDFHGGYQSRCPAGPKHHELEPEGLSTSPSGKPAPSPPIARCWAGAAVATCSAATVCERASRRQLQSRCRACWGLLRVRQGEAPRAKWSRGPALGGGPTPTLPLECPAQRVSQGSRRPLGRSQPPRAPSSLALPHTAQTLVCVRLPASS